MGTTVEVHRVGLASEGLGQEGDGVSAPCGGLGDPRRESREPDHSGRRDCGRGYWGSSRALGGLRTGETTPPHLATGTQFWNLTAGT